MLPPLYAAWLTELLGGAVPEEQTATCSRCAMQADSVPEGYRFEAAAKCCTYVPTLPNYLVGGALRELPGGPGRASLERRLDEPAVCTPHGLDVSDDDRRRYQELVAGERFGRDHDLRCPHYLPEDGGLCGIWRHRNGVCATWFCKHDRGAAGQRFWHAVEALLSVVERELCHWCACQLLYHDAPPGDGEVDDLMADLPEWDAWAPHARDYYLRAAALVADLAWPEVQVIGGADVVAAAERVRLAYADLAPEPVAPALVQVRRPATLVPGTLRVSHRGPETTRLVSYSDSDALDLPSELVALLPRFDGRPTAQVLAELADEGVSLTDDLVARLVDFAVLQAPGE
jgi:hypothetical protein